MTSRNGMVNIGRYNSRDRLPLEPQLRLQNASKALYQLLHGNIEAFKAALPEVADHSKREKWLVLEEELDNTPCCFAQLGPKQGCHVVPDGSEKKSGK